ncbi:Helicase associated domain protein [Streptomyces sp. NPDC002671]
MLKASERALFPHQSEAADAACKVLSATSRATGVLPCGTGKTRVGAEVAHRVAAAGQGQRLVVVPTLELVHQTMREWADHLGRPALGRIVAVCSDKEILGARRCGQEAQAADTAVTVDAGHLAQLASMPGPVTIASTYASLGVLTEAQALHGLAAPDVAVIDEAHRTAGAAGKSWAAIHYDDVLAVRRRLYLTATPRVVTGDHDEVISMADERLYGPVAYRLSFATAIQLGLLADYRLVVPVVTGKQVRALLGTADAYLKVGKAGVAASMLATQLAVLRAAHEHGIRRMITFHRSVQDAKWFSVLLPHAYALLAPHERPTSLWADFVHGNQNPHERRRALGRLAGDDEGLTVISNARVLSEGVDVPAVDAVCFLNARGTIDTIQATGRALRRGDRSRPKTASIIVPVVLDAGQDPETALSSSVFGPVWQTVRALASHDEELSLELETTRRTLAEPDVGRRPADMLPDWLSFSGIPVPERFAQAVSVRTVRMTTSSWSENLRAAELYLAKYGNLLVPQGHITSTGLKLGIWISDLRRRYREDALTQSQIQQMEALGMVWSYAEHRFQLLIHQLRAYKKKHGHLHIHKDYVAQHDDGTTFNLGTIAARLRVAHGRGEVDAAKVKALDAEGFVWDNTPDWWGQFIADLTHFRHKYGHLDVRQEYTVQDRNLGTQVVRVRYESEKLTKDQRRELDNLGFAWDLQRFRFDLHIQALKDFRTEHGSLRVPNKYVTQPPAKLRLGQWLNSCLYRYRKGKLSAVNAQQLHDAGVCLTSTPGNQP